MVTLIPVLVAFSYVSMALLWCNSPFRSMKYSCMLDPDDVRPFFGGGLIVIEFVVVDLASSAQSSSSTEKKGQACANKDKARTTMCKEHEQDTLSKAVVWLRSVVTFVTWLISKQGFLVRNLFCILSTSSELENSVLEINHVTCCHCRIPWSQRRRQNLVSC